MSIFAAIHDCGSALWELVKAVGYLIVGGVIGAWRERRRLRVRSGEAT